MKERVCACLQVTESDAPCTVLCGLPSSSLIGESKLVATSASVTNARGTVQDLGRLTNLLDVRLTDSLGILRVKAFTSGYLPLEL